ncbi:ABC transporter ATP-binding protein [Paenibacillus elgii]
MVTMVIETENLTRRFGKLVSVNNIDLKVPKGEIYGFLGPNGAGKTTTIRMLLGLIRPTSGEIRIFGQKLSGNELEILKKIGSLVEAPSYYSHLSGLQNLIIITKMLGLPEQRIEEAMEIVRLSKDARRPVKGYSLGMRQRLGIAMALIAKPELLILDEPTNGLDPAGIQEIRELITRLPHDYGATVLVSSHLLSEVEQMATHVGIIHQGALIFQDSLSALTARSMPKLRIETDNTHNAAVALQQLGWSVEADKDAVVIPTVDRSQSAAVVEALVERRYPVYRAIECRKTLEDIFLELTGKGQSL